MTNRHTFIIFVLLLSAACAGLVKDSPTAFTGAKGEVKLITLNPGHFHAALVQKSMYDQVSPEVAVYAPDSPDVKDHLNRIERFNTREQDPTAWIEKVYTGPDFLERMFLDKPGNVVVVSGNNAEKTDYILQAAQAGLHVLADKPMVITPEKFPMLVEAFENAKQNQVLIYDIMTERYEITTLLQKELSRIVEIFGTLQRGSPEEPAVTKESVHHFFKHVAGQPIKRPAWFFDTDQVGEGLTDVSTHLVDLIQWECFPGKILDSESDIKMISARRWATPLTPEQFNKVTRLDAFPDYLKKAQKNGALEVFSNGEMVYTLCGVHAKVSVIWNYQAPEGAKDMHYSIMRGTKCNLIIRQGKEENYKPTLYIEALKDMDITSALELAVNQTLQNKFKGIRLEAREKGKWVLNVPDNYKVGHEAHFAQVTKKYLNYLKAGHLPAWEVPNMIAKYYTTTEALKMARKP